MAVALLCGPMLGLSCLDMDFIEGRSQGVSISGPEDGGMEWGLSSIVNLVDNVFFQLTQVNLLVPCVT